MFTEYNMTTVLAEIMFTNCKSSLQTAHSEPTILLCFTEFGVAFYLVIQPYVL